MKKLLEVVEDFREDMIKTLCDLIEIKAISPDFGGEGELEKAEYLMRYFDGFDYVERFDAEDNRARGGVRPNVVAKVKGELNRTIWIVAHIDVVPEGDISLWKTPPFKATVIEDRIYGRGAEDNGQSLVASLYAAKAIIEAEIKPKYTLGLAYVSDEESGSRYGIQHLLKLGIFNRDDMILVPDVGKPDGSYIEIAEKSLLWLKFKVYGIQSHASTPKLNAARRAMKFLLDLDEKLHSRYNAKNELFNPPYSTFEPTKREKNVDNINTIPGIDISYMDCRILPEYDLDEILEFIEDVKKFYEAKDNAKIEVEVLQKESSPPTPENAELVKKLRKIIEELREVKTKVYGIGGNTCASFFRKAGFVNTVAWCTVDGTAHQPNEYCRIENMVEDAKVFAMLPL